MIIIMSLTLVNYETASLLQRTFYPKDRIEYYPVIDFSGCKDEHLILLDLSADGVIPTQISSELLADKLLQLKLPSSIRTMDLYMSDIDSDINLREFSEKMANHLATRYQKIITFRVVSDLNYDCTLLIPPILSDEPWQVFGIYKKFLPEEKRSLETLSQIKDKALLWEGSNLAEWFANPAMNITARNKNELTGITLI